MLAHLKSCSSVRVWVSATLFFVPIPTFLWLRLNSKIFSSNVLSFKYYISKRFQAHMVGLDRGHDRECSIFIGIHFANEFHLAKIVGNLGSSFPSGKKQGFVVDNQNYFFKLWFLSGSVKEAIISKEMCSLINIEKRLRWSFFVLI